MKHFDKVIFGSETEFDEETKLRMKHGVDNEQNAMVTLVSKILPVYYPGVDYFEEGCYEVIVNETPLIVVSPDGSGRRDSSNGVVVAFEFKCPAPGKTFTTPIHYEVPTRYVPQLLAEMAVLQCTTLLYVSWSKATSTIFEVKFDQSLWDELCAECINVYGAEHPVRPARKSEASKVLKGKLASFVTQNTKLLAEVQSVTADMCSHEESEPTLLYNDHIQSSANTDTDSYEDTNYVKRICTQAVQLVGDAQNRVKEKAKEVLVWIATDLDRIADSEGTRTLPICYAMKGYSLSNAVFREMHLEVLQSLHASGIYTPISSSDGQWHRVAVRDEQDQPLTLLQLQKDTFQEAKKMQKSAILKELELLIAELDGGRLPVLDGEEYTSIMVSRTSDGQIIYHIGPWSEQNTDVHNFWSNELVQKLIHRAYVNQVQKDQATRTCQSHVVETQNEDMFRVLDTLDASGIDLQSIINGGMDDLAIGATNPDPHRGMLSGIEVLGDVLEVFEDSDIPDIPATSNHGLDEHSTQRILQSNDFENMMDSLKNMEYKESRKTRWSTMTLAQFEACFKSAQSISDNFFLPELKSILDPIIGKMKNKGIKCNKSLSKGRLCNLLSTVCGDGSQLVIPEGKRKTETHTLGSICMDKVNKITKDTLNAIKAEMMWPDKLKMWKDRGPFRDDITVEGVGDILYWFSQPEFITSINQYHFFVLDFHHQFTNARYKCCKDGIPQAGISRNAWLRVAKDVNNKTRLSRAMVEDLVDRQSAAFADTTFSAEVEEVMRENGDVREADFCQLLRGMHDAVDTPSISAPERIQKMLALREWLMKDVDMSTFPPYGQYVKGIPYVEFEGLMIGIERRIQMYAVIPAGNYNARTIGSLEAENFFSGFAELHSAGSGVLKPCEVRPALSTACELLATRIDPDRYDHRAVN